MPDDRGVGVAAGELEFDVAVELLEALFARELWARRAEQQAQPAGGIEVAHVVSPRRGESGSSPLSASRALSFRRASCRVL